MEKSEAAFRTISEAADLLETPAHVLRFWESRFPQIKPVKRAGGRRYYRPADVALLSGIRRLLHDEGMTIRGVQKILREQGVRHVASLAEPDTAALDAAFEAVDLPDQPDPVEVAAAVATVLAGPGRIKATDSVADTGVGSATPSPAPPLAATVAAVVPAPPERQPVPVVQTPLADSPAAALVAAPPPEPNTGQIDLFTPLPGTPAASPPPEATGDETDTAPAARTGEIWLPAVLRQLSAPQVAPRLARLQPLQARLLALRNRMAAATDPGRR
ncbi:MAG: MerR family transcriptional regulator [Pseudorhodobacter sp.]|nr:MerR family transcriptional regulator [Pseudorhodobacter sp.]